MCTSIRIKNYRDTRVVKLNNIIYFLLINYSIPYNFNIFPVESKIILSYDNRGYILKIWEKMKKNEIDKDM